jgi:hypothetical protein
MPSGVMRVTRTGMSSIDLWGTGSGTCPPLWENKRERGGVVGTTNRSIFIGGRAFGGLVFGQVHDLTLLTDGGLASVSDRAS